MSIPTRVLSKRHQPKKNNKKKRNEDGKLGRESEKNKEDQRIDVLWAKRMRAKKNHHPYMCFLTLRLCNLEVIISVI